VTRPLSLACRRWLTIAAALGILGAGVANVIAQTASEPALKAAFIYNFAKFTEWPADSLPAGAPLVLCVAEDAHVEKALAVATKDRHVEQHPLVTKRMDLDGLVGTCHVLYVDAGVGGKRSAQLIERLRGTRTLTVSDDEAFAERGGGANLFIEDGRIRIAVNLDATQRVGLRLSSQLLKLAKIVKDAPNVSQR
jgi:hypothetical protein